MDKNYFGIAAILFGAGYFVQSLPFAQAYPQGPSVGMGAVPYKSFSGDIQNATTITLLTVPSDQVFIVTTCIATSNYINLKEDSTVVLEGGSGACSGDVNGNTTSYREGLGHLTIPSGTTLTVTNSHGSYSYAYHVEGYYAQP